MKYLCLCYYDPDAVFQLDAAGQQEIGRECEPHDVALKATGKVVIQASLAEREDWFHFLPSDRGPLFQDGAYLQGGQQPGAFFILEAESLEEAKDVASKHATANYGAHIGFALEVRPCMMYENN